MKKILLIILLLSLLVGCMPQPSYDMVYNTLETSAVWMKNSMGDVWGYMKLTGNTYRWGAVNNLTQKTLYSGPLLWSDIQLYINYYKAMGYQYTTIYQIPQPILTVIITTILRILPSSVWFVILPNIQQYFPTPVPTNGGEYPSP